MDVCERVTFECPACGHVFAAVPDSDERCAGCGRPVNAPLVRPCRPEEVRQVLQLWGEARSSYAQTVDRAEVIAAMLSAAPDTLLVAEEDGRVVGTLIAAWDGWRGNMYRLAVVSDRRRRGLARELIREGERRLRAKGARRVTALVPLDDDPANATWAAAGYDRDAGIGRFVRDL